MMNRLMRTSSTVIALVAAVLQLACGKNDATTNVTSGNTITVTGKVIDSNRQPVAGVPVQVVGKPSTNSDQSGNFTIASVTVPYDILVINATAKAALVYKGLSRSDPTLIFLTSTLGGPPTATVSGKISGGVFLPDQPADHITRVAFASPDGRGSATTLADGTFGPLNVTWFGPTTTTGSLHAIQFRADANGNPLASGYKGYGTRAGVTLTAGNNLAGQTDTLQIITTTQATGTVSVPAGYIFTSTIVGLRLSADLVLSLFADTSHNTSFAYYTPNISGATLELRSIASKTGSLSIAYTIGITPSMAGAAVTFLAAPGQSLPINNAAGVDTSVTFSWTPFTGGVHLVVFSSTGNPTYYIVTTGISTTIPNLKAAGLGLPSAGSYSWNVTGFAPFASVDAAAGPNGFLSALTNPALLATNSYLGLSGARTFTTAP